MNKNLTAYLLDRHESVVREIDEAHSFIHNLEVKDSNVQNALDYLISATTTLSYIVWNLVKYGDTND